MIDVEIEDEAWSAALPDAEALVVQAAAAALQILPRETGEGDREAVEGARFSSAGSAEDGGATLPNPPPGHAPSTASRSPSPAGGGGFGVTVLLTDDETARDLNARFRGKDYATNVLSFPSPANPEQHLGDIALAYGVCAREAGEQGKPLAHHLQHLVAHGVLHLLGYDHETDPDAEAMEELEREILAGLGVPDPYAAEQGKDA